MMSDKVVTDFKKDARVEWKYEDKRKYGTIVHVGKSKLTVINDGGKILSRGKCEQFKLTKKPVPIDEPNHMDKWSVVDLREFKYNNGSTKMFTAKISLNGIKILNVRCDGYSDYNMYFPTIKGSRKLEMFFHEEANKWISLFNGIKVIKDPADAFVDWYLYHRKFGCTGKEYIKLFKKKQKEINDNAKKNESTSNK